MKVPILAYHKVGNRLELGINTVPIRAFESQIKYLHQKNYYSISLHQYIHSVYPSSSERSPIIITFDDGDESVSRHAFPILAANGFKATLFVITNYVGKRNTWDANLGGSFSRHLNWAQIKELSDAGWEIGSHTATHRDLVRLSSEETTAELYSSREILEQNVNQPIRFISYPFNRFDQRIISLAGQVGYTGGCALAVSKKNQDLPGRFIIPRYGVYGIDTNFWFKQKLTNCKMEQIKQRLISRASIGTILYQRLRG